MITASVMVQNLCVPCACRCRYCLLSWDGKPVGIPWEAGTALGQRLLREIGEERPSLKRDFAFGYAMDPPDLPGVLRLLREIGSPQAEFLQCDGMRFRDERGCRRMAEMMAAEGVKQLSFTLYGLPSYHDRFAGRPGDFDQMRRMMDAAAMAGLALSVRVPVTQENVAQIDPLIGFLRAAWIHTLSLFIPHEEGRGGCLAPVRLRESDLARLSPDARDLLNRCVYRAERAWIASPDAGEETRRALLISLREDNARRYAAMSGPDVLSEIEALDDAYYAAFPSFGALAALYGDPDGDNLYSRRDLFARYRRLYAQEKGVLVYDVTDERQSGSRRY